MVFVLVSKHVNCCVTLYCSLLCVCVFFCGRQQGVEGGVCVCVCVCAWVRPCEYVVHYNLLMLLF